MPVSHLKQDIQTKSGVGAVFRKAGDSSDFVSSVSVPVLSRLDGAAVSEPSASGLWIEHQDKATGSSCFQLGC